MKQLGVREITVIAVFGLIGRALCAATMFVGMAVTSLQTTIITHTAGAPVIFAVISWIYFTKFGYTRPPATAVAFVGIVVFVDFFLVALVINRSLEMFESLPGTWIPWALTFPPPI